MKHGAELKVRDFESDPGESIGLAQRKVSGTAYKVK